MKQSLNIKLTQGLKLTPQLQQSIRLLQLSSIELNAEVQEMLDSNPLLEEEPITLEKSRAELEKQAELDSQQENQEPDWQQQFETRQSTQSSTSISSSEPIDIYATSSSQSSLEDELIWQVKMSKLSDRDRNIAQAIIYSLNSEGYLTLTNEEIVDLLPDEMEFDPDEVAAIVKLIQHFEPTGVAARNLQERLLLILQNLENKNPQLAHNVNHYLAKCIAQDYLDLLAKRNFPALKNSLDIDQEQLIQAVQYIQKISPHIESQNSEDENIYIIPDIIVKEVNNKWVIQLNPTLQKNVRLNDSYISIPKENLSGDASKYINDSLQEAKWFIKSLNNRYDTLKRVADAIVKNQIDFFRKGESALKPMVLQQIAEELDLHESTISRATSNKYMQTPLGVYELKYFFSTSLSSNDGEGVSANAIRSIIKKLINDEEKNKPISDNKIATILEEKGFKVARRTVAKYREGMNIPSSSKRKSLV